LTGKSIKVKDVIISKDYTIPGGIFSPRVSAPPHNRDRILYNTHYLLNNISSLPHQLHADFAISICVFVTKRRVFAQ